MNNISLTVVKTLKFYTIKDEVMKQKLFFSFIIVSLQCWVSLD